MGKRRCYLVSLAAWRLVNTNTTVTGFTAFSVACFGSAPEVSFFSSPLLFCFSPPFRIFPGLVRVFASVTVRGRMETARLFSSRSQQIPLFVVGFQPLLLFCIFYMFFWIVALQSHWSSSVSVHGTFFSVRVLRSAVPPCLPSSSALASLSFSGDGCARPYLAFVAVCA